MEKELLVQATAQTTKQEGVEISGNTSHEVPTTADNVTLNVLGTAVATDSEIGGSNAQGNTATNSDTAVHYFSVNPTVGTANSIEISHLDQGATIIGGNCCVHLSIEYMPLHATLGSTVPPSCKVIVDVQDSEGTLMRWGKIFSTGYHTKECIISTNPGAQLIVRVTNAIARVRWCEIFSC